MGASSVCLSPCLFPSPCIPYLSKFMKVYRATLPQFQSIKLPGIPVQAGIYIQVPGRGPSITQDAVAVDLNTPAAGVAGTGWGGTESQEEVLMKDAEYGRGFALFLSEVSPAGCSLLEHGGCPWPPRGGPQTLLSFAFFVFLLYMETDKKSPGEGKLIHPSRFQRLQLRASPVTSPLITFYFSNLPIGVPPGLWFTLIRAGLQAEAGIHRVRGVGVGEEMRRRPVAVLLPAELSEGLNVLSRDSIGLPDSFHPSDERTVAALSGLGAILLEERARATQIKNSPFPSRSQAAQESSVPRQAGWRLLSVLIKVTGPGPQPNFPATVCPFLQSSLMLTPRHPQGGGGVGQPSWPPECREVPHILKVL